jgi:aminopeptidase N/puromycin-sensitive aminopeptidase
LGTLGTLGEDREVLDRAAQTARRWLADPASVSADLARIALPLAARHGDAALHERLAAVLAAAQTPEARMLALAGLGAFEQPALIERTLSLILDGTIRSQDIRYVLPPMAWRRTTRDVTHRWVEANIDALLKVIPAISVGRLARLAAAPCDAARVRGAEAFLRPRLARFEGTDKEMRQAVEEGLRCAALADKERPATSAWLAEAR